MPSSFPLREQIVPNLRRILCRKENFHAVFAGVAGARDGQFDAVVIEVPDLIACRQLDVRSDKRLEKLDHARSLNRESRRNPRCDLFQGAV